MDLGGLSSMRIDLCYDMPLQIGRELFRKMNDKVILFFCIKDPDRFLTKDQGTGVAYLPAAFGIKGSSFQHYLPGLFALCLYLPVFCDAGIALQHFITYKLDQRVIDQHDPVLGIDGGCSTGAVFLLFHFSVESYLVDR